MKLMNQCFLSSSISLIQFFRTFLDCFGQCLSQSNASTINYQVFHLLSHHQRTSITITIMLGWSNNGVYLYYCLRLFWALYSQRINLFINSVQIQMNNHQRFYMFYGCTIIFVALLLILYVFFLKFCRILTYDMRKVAVSLQIITAKVMSKQTATAKITKFPVKLWLKSIKSQQKYPNKKLMKVIQVIITMREIKKKDSQRLIFRQISYFQLHTIFFLNQRQTLLLQSSHFMPSLIISDLFAGLYRQTRLIIHSLKQSRCTYLTEPMQSQGADNSFAMELQLSKQILHYLISWQNAEEEKFQRVVLIVVNVQLFLFLSLFFRDIKLSLELAS